MKIKLIKKVILDSLDDEEEYFDLCTEESIYAMRKLKALVDSLELGSIFVHDVVGPNGQLFSSEYNICFNEGEFEVIEESSK